MAGSPAATLIAVTALLFFVILSLFGWRIYMKVKQRRFRWDDYSIILATILALVEWSLVIAATSYGFGRSLDSSSQYLKLQAHRVLVASELVWIPTTAFIRIGIAFTFLHFKQSRPWRITLSLLITIQILFCIINLVFLVVQCIPMDYVWNETVHENAVCTTGNPVLASRYVHAGVGTATDFILALTPLSFVHVGPLLTREGILSALVITLGLFATTCSTLRVVLLRIYTASPETRFDAVKITLWSLLEVQALLIAANTASFKTPPAAIPPPSHHYSSARRRHRRNPKSRRTSSLSHTDLYQLPSLRLSLTQSHKHSLGHDTNVSSLTGSSTLKRSRSEEIIWSREQNRLESGGGDHDDDRYEGPFHHLHAAGGILMTTELDVRSEVLSRVGSSEGDRLSREQARREEWAVVEEGEAARADWNAV